jgi:hypothetical protein
MLLYNYLLLQYGGKPKWTLLHHNGPLFPNIYIPHNIVESLIIVDDLYNVFTSATIVLNNTKNNIDIYSNYNY